MSCSKVIAQKTLYSSDAELEQWFSCDTSMVKVSLNANKQIQADIVDGYWACIGVMIPTQSVEELNKIEMILKAESETPIQTTQVMVRFKDVNGNQTDDGTLPTNNTLLVNGKYYTYYSNFNGHLHSSNGHFDAKKVNTILIFVHYESYMVKEFTGRLTVKELRLL